MSQPTLLAVLAHPDDEVLCAGTLLAQRAAGSRVVILWLTRGEMTDAWGPLPTAEVAERRMELGMQVAECLGVEGRFLSFPDSSVQATPEAGDEVARVMAEIKPSGLITWGDAWARGFRHPDHQATGKLRATRSIWHASPRLSRRSNPTERSARSSHCGVCTPGSQSSRLTWVGMPTRYLR